MDDAIIYKALEKAGLGGMQTMLQAITILRLVADTSDVPGDICEFGVNAGHTARLMASASKKKIWLYDSGRGVPAPTPVDGSHLHGGEMPADPCHAYAAFEEYKLPKPTFVCDWFSNVGPDRLPERIAFAHIDGDLYQSTMEAMRLVYPRLSPGGIMLFHDWDTKHLPGVSAAIKEFMADKPERLVIPRRFDGATGQQVYIVREQWQ